MKRYRVILPIDIDGKAYGHGAVVELPLETAAEYSHALIEVEEKDGGNGEKL